MLRSLSFAAIGLASLANAADIVVFGDSWGTEGEASFIKMATAHNLTVKDYAVAGSTAQEWARTPDKLTKWVQDNPDCKYVWVTIGGNDAQPMLARGDSIDEITSKVLGWTQEFYEPLFKAVPDIKVVQFGYDILFWDYFECVITADETFHRCGKHGDANFTFCANDLFFNLQFQYTDKLADMYPQVTSPNLLGSFQSGVMKNVTVGNPDPYSFSPNKYTNPTKFCLHANDEGYDIVFKNLWDLYFSKQEAERLGSRPA